MTQRQLNREVADVTGETVGTIERMGFVPLTSVPIEREPLVMDWDDEDDYRGLEIGPRHGRSRVLA